MKFSNTLWLFVFVMGSSAWAGSNRDESNIFPDKKPGDEGGTQIVLGLGETVTGALTLIWGTTNDSSAFKFAADPETIVANEKLVDAHKKLKEAKALTLDTQRAALVEKAQLELATVKEGSKAYRKIQVKIIDLKAMSVVSEAEKMSKVAALEESISKLRLEQLTKMNALWTARGKALFRSAKIVGGALMIVDVADRIYVWNVLDKSPTFSPIVRRTLEGLRTGFEYNSEGSH